MISAFEAPQEPQTPVETTAQARKRVAAAIERVWTRDEAAAVSQDLFGADNPSHHPEHTFLIQDPGGPLLRILLTRIQAGPQGFGYMPTEILVIVNIEEKYVSDSALRIWADVTNTVHELIGAVGALPIRVMAGKGGTMLYSFKPRDVNVEANKKGGPQPKS